MTKSYVVGDHTDVNTFVDIVSRTVEDILVSLRSEAPYLFRMDWTPLTDEELSQPCGPGADESYLNDAEIEHLFAPRRTTYAPPIRVHPIPTATLSDIERRVSEWKPAFGTRMSKEDADHNRAMLREALLLGARGFMPMPAGRPHPMAGSTSNLKAYMKAIKRGVIPTAETIAGRAKSAKLPVGIRWPSRASCDLDAIVENFTRYPVDVYKDGIKTGNVEFRDLDFAGNICIVTGMRAGYAVADIDGKDARELWNTFGVVPKTVQSLSGSGVGDHYFFRTPPGVELHNTASKFGTHGIKGAEGTNLDVRGYHGQVIVAPSLHKTGGTYQWVNSPHDTAMVMAPDWWLTEAIACSQVAQREQAERDGTVMPSAGSQRADVDNVDDQAEGHDNLSGGFRNRVAQIGYGEGTANCCHYAINSAALAFFVERGHAADAKVLYDALRARLDVATKAYPEKRYYYDDTAGLKQRIEDARAYATALELPAEKVFGFDGYEDATDAARSIGKGDIRSAETFIKRMLVTSGISIGERLILRQEVTRSGITAKQYDALDSALVKEAKAKRRKVELDTDSFNERYAVFTGQSKVEFLRLSRIPGRLPAQYSEHDFMLMADARVVIRVDERTGRELRAGALWIDDPNRREVDRMDFAPPGAAPLPEGTLNLWNGMPLLDDRSSWDRASLEASAWPFLDYLRRVMTNGDAEGYEWVLNWLADIEKNPGKKRGVALAFVGGFGGGKSTFYEVLGDWLGDYLLKMNSLNQTSGQFNEHKACKLLLVSEEVSHAGDRANTKQQRDEATSETQLVNPKFRSAYVLNDFSRKLYLGNDLKELMRVEEGDRRLTVFRTSDVYEEMRLTDPEGQQAYFRNLRASMKNGGLASFVELLRRRKFDADSLRNPHETSAKLAMMIHQGGPAERWLRDSVKLGEFASNVRDLKPVYLDGPEAVIVKHKGKDMIALPQKELRAHFLDVLRAAPERYSAAKYGTLDALGDLLTDKLGADPEVGRAKVDGEACRCWFVPPRHQIMSSWVSRGWVTATEVDDKDPTDWPDISVPSILFMEMANAMRSGNQKAIRDAWKALEDAKRLEEAFGDAG